MIQIAEVATVASPMQKRKDPTLDVATNERSMRVFWLFSS